MLAHQGGQFAWAVGHRWVGALLADEEGVRDGARGVWLFDEGGVGNAGGGEGPVELGDVLQDRLGPVQRPADVQPARLQHLPCTEGVG